MIPEPKVPPDWPPDDALPIAGWADVELSAERMWAHFADVASWHRWNPCIWRARVRGGELRQGARLEWVFNAIRPWYPYKLPAVATIVECEPGRRVTWEVRLPGFRALHSYLIEPVDDDRCRFGSWEIGRGAAYRLLRPFWLAHFRYVCRASIEGARLLGESLHPGVRVRRYGVPGDRPPLVVVPGIDGSPGSVGPIIDRLSQGRQVLLLDYTTEQNRSLEDLAAEMSAAVSEVTGGPVDLLGQSIGTLAAAMVATSGNLLQVRKVVLIATFTRARSRALKLSNGLGRLTPRPLFKLTVVPLMAVVCGPVGDGWRHPFFAAVRRSDPTDGIRRTAWQVDRDFRPVLASVRQPTRVLMGAKDRFVPDAGREIARLREIFGDDRVVVVPGAGHVMLPSAAVDRVVAEIEAFTA